MDGARRAVARRAVALARWVDAFFQDETYAEEEADARIRVRQSVAERSRGSAEFRTRVQGKLTLPNVSRRFSLRVEGNEDRLAEDPADDGLVDSVDEGVERPSVALEYRPARDRDTYASFRVGVRADPALYLGPRFRCRQPMGEHWLGRASLDVRWFTDDGWRPDLTLDLDRPVGPTRLFRQRVGVAWREDRRDTDGVRVKPTTSFTHALSDVSALRYAWSATHESEPRSRWTATVVTAQYRRRAFRDWLFVEIAPFVAFEREHDWRRDPGLQLVIEIVFEADALSPRPVRRPGRAEAPGPEGTADSSPSRPSDAGAGA
jgi:hypothetical protein